MTSADDLLLLLFSSEMFDIFYSGFNGYSLCPTDFPKVINSLTRIIGDEVIDFQCTLRNFVFKNKSDFKIYTIDENLQVVTKTIIPPASPNVFTCLENGIVCASGLKIWKCNFSDDWAEFSLKPPDSEKGRLWTEGCCISKLLLQDEKLFILLSNGSIWRISEEEKLNLVFAPEVDEAIDIVCGFEHILILTESGCVLSLGIGSRGQLGNGDLNSSDVPVQIPALMGLKAVKIAAGGWHSCAIMDTGDLYTWGWNNYGQLGYPCDDGNTTENNVGLSATPLFVDVEPNTEMDVVDVACGTRHTVVKLGKNHVYSTGWNAYGQLGTGHTASHNSLFTKLNINLGEISKLSCGPWSSHVMCMNNELTEYQSSICSNWREN